MNTCNKIKCGELAQGCKWCIPGRKSVLFITGHCHYNCFYCPISDDKRNHDLVKINEHIIHHPDTKEAIQELINECETCQSKGVGITGGDPLARVERTVKYITALKNHFGKKFHIHLYTPPNLVTKGKLAALEKAGLDEIRFHLDVESDKLWKRIEVAHDSSMLRGFEIPVIPGCLDQTKKIMDYAKSLGWIRYVNLNELEFSDISDNALTKKGFVVKNELSYGILGSEEEAKMIVEYGKSIGMATHYCSAGFKDRVQLGNRLILRAKKAALPLDIVDDEGMLTRGVIRCKNFKKVIELLLNEFDVPDEFIYIDGDRLLVASWVLEEIVSDLRKMYDDELGAEVVVEYPTDDRFVVEKTIL